MLLNTMESFIFRCASSRTASLCRGVARTLTKSSSGSSLRASPRAGMQTKPAAVRPAPARVALTSPSRAQPIARAGVSAQSMLGTKSRGKL